MTAIKCDRCDEIATHHHSGNHFCATHAREYSAKAKWRRVMFWYTPKGARKTELGTDYEYLEAIK